MVYEPGANIALSQTSETFVAKLDESLLTGLPPFFGFVAKLRIFYAVFESGYFWLGVIGLINGVISLYYYARILAMMHLSDAEEGEPEAAVKLALPDRVLCTVLVVPLLVFGLFWISGIIRWADAVVPAIFGGN